MTLEGQQVPIVSGTRATQSSTRCETSKVLVHPSLASCSHVTVSGSSFFLFPGDRVNSSAAYFVRTGGRLLAIDGPSGPVACEPVVCPIFLRRRCPTTSERRRASFPNHLPGAASVWIDLSRPTPSGLLAGSLPISSRAGSSPGAFALQRVRQVIIQHPLINGLSCVGGDDARLTRPLPIHMIRYRSANPYGS